MCNVNSVRTIIIIKKNYHHIVKYHYLMMKCYHHMVKYHYLMAKYLHLIYNGICNVPNAGTLIPRHTLRAVKLNKGMLS